MKSKDRSMVCRIAGNIAGPMYANMRRHMSSDDSMKITAARSVELAMGIVENVDQQIAEDTQEEKDSLHDEDLGPMRREFRMHKHLVAHPEEIGPPRSTSVPITEEED